MAYDGFDNVIVTGKMQVEYKNNLLVVLTWLSDAGLTLKEAKCEFGMTEVQYLGYQVSSCGLEPLADQIQPVKNAPAPTSVSKLKSYLGMRTYYNRFLPNVSTVMEPLHELLWTGVEWEWTTERDRAFKTTKEMLKAASVLTHYNQSKPCFLVMRLPMVLELCYHISVTAGRKCQSRLRQVSFMPVSDPIPNWIRRGCQWHM